MVITATVSPAKFAARPGVEVPKRRTTGFSSRPPFCRFERVIAKSAPLKAAELRKRTLFSVSQNLCRVSTVLGLTVTNSTNAFVVAAAGGASGSGPCPRARGHRADATRRALQDRTFKHLARVIGAAGGVG